MKNLVFEKLSDCVAFVHNVDNLLPQLIAASQCLNFIVCSLQLCMCAIIERRACIVLPFFK